VTTGSPVSLPVFSYKFQKLFLCGLACLLLLPAAINYQPTTLMMQRMIDWVGQLPAAAIAVIARKQSKERLRTYPWSLPSVVCIIDFTHLFCHPIYLRTFEQASREKK
jgi:hypothetical protein